MRWTSHPFEGLCTNRVTFTGTDTGTNGKGTSEEYCLASGFAEFMERLQNNILGRAALSGAEVTSSNLVRATTKHEVSRLAGLFS